MTDPISRLDWLPPGFDLRFIERGTRPKSLKELLCASDEAWRRLFVLWLRDDSATRGEYTMLAKANAASGYRAVDKALTRAQKDDWQKRIDHFVAFCGQVRWRLQQDRRDVKRQGITSEREVEAELNRRGQARIAQDRMVSYEVKDIKGLVRFEAEMLERTATVKPQFHELYSKFVAAEPWSSRDQAVTLLGSVYTTVISAEGELRRMMGQLRGLDPVRRSGGDDDRLVMTVANDVNVELAQAWAGYFQSYVDLAEATQRAAEMLSNWATNQTTKMLTANFSTYFPVVNGCLLAAETLVWSLRTCVAAAGLASVVVLPVAPGFASLINVSLTAATNAVSGIVRGWVATVEAQDPDVVRQHFGAEYLKPQDLDKDMWANAEAATEVTPGGASAVLGGLVNAVGDLTGVAVSTAAEASVSDAAKATVASAAPVVGEILTGLGLLVKWNEQLNPKELRITAPEERKRMLDAFDMAYDHLQQDGVDTREVTVHRVLDDGSYDVSFGAEHGVIHNGRFSPADSTRRVEAIIRQWARNPPSPLVTVSDPASAHYELLANDLSPLLWDLVAANHIGSSPEGNGVELFSFYASDRASGQPADTWQVTVAANPDGASRVVQADKVAEANLLTGDGRSLQPMDLSPHDWQTLTDTGMAATLDDRLNQLGNTEFFLYLYTAGPGRFSLRDANDHEVLPLP